LARQAPHSPPVMPGPEPGIRAGPPSAGILAAGEKLSLVLFGWPYQNASFGDPRRPLSEVGRGSEKAHAQQPWMRCLKDSFDCYSNS
jgi:hypothetical protein